MVAPPNSMEDNKSSCTMLSDNWRVWTAAELWVNDMVTYRVGVVCKVVLFLIWASAYTTARASLLAALPLHLTGMQSHCSLKASRTGNRLAKVEDGNWIERRGDFGGVLQAHQWAALIACCLARWSQERKEGISISVLEASGDSVEDNGGTSWR